MTDTTSNYTQSGVGNFVYDDADQHADITTTGSEGLSFSHSLSAADEGTFSFDFRAIQRNAAVGSVELILYESANTYYRIVDRSGGDPVTVSSFTIRAENQDASFDNIEYLADGSVSSSSSSVSIYVALGDSISYGYGDDLAYDDISQDGLSIGGGYGPVLNDMLSTATGYSNPVRNEGVIGETSYDGLVRLPDVLSQNPDAGFYLVMFGMNDARPSLPVPSGLGLNPDDENYPGTYKDNMQQIINLIHSTGAKVYLAKIPIALADTYADENLYEDPDQGARSLLIKEYNMVVDELVGNPLNQITVTPPDLYAYFKDHCEDEYSDNIHPNGTEEDPGIKWLVAD